MDSQRFLRCLGQPALYTSAGEPVRFRTRKHLALLVYIAVENRVHRRDRLAELLWPNVSATEARHSLATALSVLRPRVGIEALETSRDQVRLLPGSVRLDLERLEAGDILGSELTAPLEVAPFLDAFDVSESAEFTHWKDRVQARLLPVIKDALLVLMDRCRRTGDTRQIERLADRMLALDELSEEAIRAKMEARAFAGDRLTALEIFEEWKAKLAEELQAVPSDLVEGMAVRLRRRGWERTTLANIPNVPTDQWRGRPFIGRAAEYCVLYELWEGVPKGIPGHALILGDSGVGKTTLVQRLTTAAGLEGAAISRVQCYDVEREIPYSTLSGLIIGLMDRPGVSATSPEALAELSRTVPQVRQRFPHLPRPNDSQGETVRIRLTEAFLEMLTAIAEEHPVVLVVDDLHLADDVSLAVLHLVMRRARGLPIMVVLVARSGEMAQATQALRLRESGSALGITEIDLAPLSEDESREMLESLVPSDEPQPGVTSRRALLRAAAGFPMVLELLVQDWKVSGEQSLALAIDAMTTDLRSHAAGRSAYTKILDRITRSLDNITQNVLNMAAILGRRLNELENYGIVDLSIGQTMTGLADLVNRRVLRDGATGLEFANELIRTACYIGVPTSLRHLLHSNIADRLISRTTPAAEDLRLEIAWHCMRAGRCTEAISYLLEGARHAMRAGALEAGEKALSSALLQTQLNGSQREDAVILLASILQEQGRWQDSLELLDRERHTGLVLSASWVKVLTIAANFYIYGCPSEETNDNLTILSEIIRKGHDSSVRVAAAGIAATLIATTRQECQARNALEAISLIPNSGLSTQDLSRLSLAKARFAYHVRDRSASLREIESTLSSMDSSQELTTTAAQFRAGLGTMSCINAQYAQAIHNLERAQQIAIRLGNDTLRAGFTANLALAHGRLGNYEMQLHNAEESLSISRSQRPDFTEFLASYCAAFACAFLGSESRAKMFLTQANLRRADTLPPWASQAWSLYVADLHFLLGEIDAARDTAIMATSGSNARPHVRDFAGAFSRWLAILATSAHQISEANRIVGCFLSDLPMYDFFDRAEIVASRRFLARQQGLRGDDLESLLLTQLEGLPSATTMQLHRLGILESTFTRRQRGMTCAECGIDK
jgi:DNA-binding SARP family transcriptional activator/tetratricopeptide (TPR) repeat protein